MLRQRWVELVLLLTLGVTTLSIAETVMQGDVRLQGGAVDSEGRVEIYSDEEGWGTVCNENWDQSDGDVVCSQLGYDNASAVKSFGPGSGAILLSGLDCVGNETNLFKCPWFSRKRCIHEDDAGVVCEPADDPTIGLPATIGVYVLIPFIVIVILLLLIIAVMLCYTTSNNREARQIEEESFQNRRFKGLSLKEQKKRQAAQGIFRRRNSGISKSSSQFSVDRNIPRAALGTGTPHPWQITVDETDSEKVEVVPAVGNMQNSFNNGQQTIAVMNPLASTADGDEEHAFPKRYVKKPDESDSDSSLDPYE